MRTRDVDIIKAVSLFESERRRESDEAQVKHVRKEELRKREKKSRKARNKARQARKKARREERIEHWRSILRELDAEAKQACERGPMYSVKFWLPVMRHELSKIQTGSGLVLSHERKQFDEFRALVEDARGSGCETADDVGVLQAADELFRQYAQLRKVSEARRPRIIFIPQGGK